MTDLEEAKHANEDGRKFTRFNIASIMDDANERSGGRSEQPPAKKRRRVLWPRNRNAKGHAPRGWDSEETRPPEGTFGHAPPDGSCEEIRLLEEPSGHAPAGPKETRLLEKPSGHAPRDKGCQRKRPPPPRAEEGSPEKLLGIKKSSRAAHFTVLNIPVLSRGPVSERQKLSKIDLAISRRQSRRSKGGNDCSSSGESDREEVDLNVRAGPPCKLDLAGGKAEFLNRVDLIPHVSKNCIELRKLMRKKWLAPDIVRETSDQRIRPLDLPAPPRTSPCATSMQNHKHKRNFLHFLGLATVSSKDKEEMEEAWKAVVRDRLKRNCESPLTKYYQKSYAAREAQQNTQPPLLPLVHRYKRHISDISKSDELLSLLHRTISPVRQLDVFLALKNASPAVFEEGARQGKGEILRDPPRAGSLPLARITVNDNNGRADRAVEAENCKENFGAVREHRLKWPGLLEVREAYVRYSREKSLEIAELRKQRFILANDNLKMQNLVRFMERKQRSMQSILFKTDRENKNLQSTIDQLTNIVNSFR